VGGEICFRKASEVPVPLRKFPAELEKTVLREKPSNESTSLRGLTICCSVPGFTHSVAGRGENSFTAARPVPAGSPPSPVLAGGRARAPQATAASPRQQTGRAAAVPSASPRSPVKRAIVRPLRLLAAAGGGATRIKPRGEANGWPRSATRRGPLGWRRWGEAGILAALRGFALAECVLRGPKCRRGGQPRARSC